MKTQKEARRILCQKMMARLETQKSVQLPARLRQVVQEELGHLLAPSILTDQDLKEKVLTKLGVKAEVLDDLQFREGEAYRAAHAAVYHQLGQNPLNGFYFQKSPREVVQTVVQYLMRSPHIDDVYETDEELEKQLLDVIQKFDVSQAH